MVEIRKRLWNLGRTTLKSRTSRLYYLSACNAFIHSTFNCSWHFKAVMPWGWGVGDQKLCSICRYSKGQLVCTRPRPRPRRPCLALLCLKNFSLPLNFLMPSFSVQNEKRLNTLEHAFKRADVARWHPYIEKKSWMPQLFLMQLG